MPPVLGESFVGEDEFLGSSPRSCKKGMQNKKQFMSIKSMSQLEFLNANTTKVGPSTTKEKLLKNHPVPQNIPATYAVP